MAIDFTYRSRFDENANFTMVRWGADSPVPEVELNEMQDISEGKLRDVVKATFGNGLLGVGTVEYDAENKTLKIANEKAFVEGYLLNIESLETRVTKDVPVRLNCWKEVITAESKIYKHGNMQADFIPNKLIDERYGKEITRREQIVFNLESDDNPNTHKDKGYSLEIGSLKDLINKETGEKYVGFDVVAEKASVDAASIGKTFCFSKDTPETDEEEYLWFKQLESDEGIPTENVKEFDMVLLKVNQKEGTTEVYYPKVKWSSIIDLPDNIVYSREVADTEIPSPVNINNSGLEIGMFTVTYGDNVPAGYVEANGQEINRIVYADLLDYAKSVGLVISEADWQAKFTAQSGLVTEYGYDDGSATFRVPRIVGDSSLSEKRIIKAFGSLGDGLANYQDVIEAMKGYLPLTGGTIKDSTLTIDNGKGGNIHRNAVTSMWYNARDYALLQQKSLPNNGYSSLYSLKTNNGSWDCGAWNYDADSLILSFMNDEKYNTSKAEDEKGNIPAESNIPDMRFMFSANGQLITRNNENADEYFVKSIGNTHADESGNVNASVVVESVVNEDGSWYRKYSDGWLEQGGMLPVKEGLYFNETITLVKAMANSSYIVLLENGYPTKMNEMHGVWNKTTTSFQATNIRVSGDGQGNWYACGMGAE